VATLGAGVLIAITARDGTLDLMSDVLAAHGHLPWLFGLGLTVGAASRPEGRDLGRILILFLVSCLFYHSWAAGMWGGYRYLLLIILGTIVLDYWLAIWIDRTADPWLRRLLLIVSLVSNLGILCVFKYYDFFVGALHLPLEPMALILPAGISFHTFQSMSYTIDVYRKKLPATRSLLKFATFVLFFPQLVAGPIVRAHEFLPQLEALPRYDRERAARGLWRIVVGLFKKIALADLLAILLVDGVFKEPSKFSGIEVLFGVWGYAFQIYLDFSAYSDIAIGSAMLLGFEFPENFRTPYRSANLQEFWRRWHITLSSWLRDYLYVPLGGSKGGAWQTYRNLLITMLLGGLWHGARWTFIVWGALHGGGLAVTRVFQRRPAGRLLLGLTVMAGAGAAVHMAARGAFASAAGSLGVDPMWLHLGAAWAYLTPAWAALTAWLSLGEPPPPAASPREELRRAALFARCATVVLSGLLVTTMLRGPGWWWSPIVLAWLGAACLGDVLAAGPDGAAARRWLVWAAQRAVAVFLTFQYVCVAWIFFRATSFANARDVIHQIAGGATDAVNVRPAFLMTLAVAAAAHLFPDGTFRWARDRFVGLPSPAQAAALAGAALVLRELTNPVVVPFIYFQF
jgi:D-alanyl-lipoteichoic acid acyltransferase DltB (MBOAT superfamily)